MVHHDYLEYQLVEENLKEVGAIEFLKTLQGFVQLGDINFLAGLNLAVVPKVNFQHKKSRSSKAFATSVLPAPDRPMTNKIDLFSF